jgi:hypothetical protein
MEPTVVEVLAAVAVAVAEGKHVLCVIMDLEMVVQVEEVAAKGVKEELVVTEAVAPLEFTLTLMVKEEIL